VKLLTDEQTNRQTPDKT